MTRYTPLWLQSGSYPAAWDRMLIGALWPTVAVNGLAVSVASGMTLNIASGSIAVPSQNNTGSSLCVSDAVEQVTLASAPGSGTNRIDLVIAQPRGTDLDGGSNNDFVFTTVTGAPAATPTPPAVPAGAAAIAQVYVTGGSVSIVAGNITDRRPPFGALAVPSVQPATRAYMNAAPTSPNGWQKIPLDTVDNTTTPGMASWWDVVTNRRVTPQVGGLYLVTAAVGASYNNVNQGVRAQIYKNGTGVTAGPAQSSTGLTGGAAMGAGVVDLVRVNGTTDYLELWLNNNQANQIQLGGGPTQTYLSLLRVGA